MVQKGKLYKQWFRRDAAWAVNWGYGVYPEAFECVFHTEIFSARYAVSQFAQVVAVNTHKDYVRRWTSEPYGGFFDNVFWIFEIKAPPDDQITEVDFAIWHNAVIPTPLFSARYRTTTSNAEFNIFPCRGLQELYFLSPDVTVNPDSFRFTVQHAGYGRYNP